MVTIDKLQAEIDELRFKLETAEKNLNNAFKTIEFEQQHQEELQKKYDAMYRAFVVSDDARKEWLRYYVGAREGEDELQKRIDDALRLVQKDCTEYGISDYLEKAIKVLKGGVE